MKIDPLHKGLSRRQYDAIRRAMEDVRREEFDYYLDRHTQEVLQLPLYLIREAEKLLYETDTEYEFGVLYDSEIRTEAELRPEQEEAIELTIEVLSEPSRYIRIPERPSSHAYECMKDFAKTLSDPLRQRLLQALNGQGAFRRFKDILKSHKRLYKAWNAYNAKAMMRLIDRWLEGLYP